MANRDDRSESGSSSGRRQGSQPSSLESDDVDIPLRHHSRTGNSSQGIMPHMPIESMHYQLGQGGVISHNIGSTTHPSGHIGDIEHSSLESDNVGIPLRHHSHAGNSSQGIMPHLPIESMHYQLGQGGVISHNIGSTTHPSGHIGDIEQKFDSLCLGHRIQQLSDSTVQSSGVPGSCESVQQPDGIGKLDDTLHQLRCTICYVRWLNLVIKTCRHLNCDVCYSKGPSSICGICRGQVLGLFPIRFHSAHMIEDIDIPTIPDYQHKLIKKFMDMGFKRAAIRGAIRQTSDGLNATLDFNAILEILMSSDGSDKARSLIQSTYSIPTPEELEHILNDQKANPEDKSRLTEWLQVTAKCLICKDKPPCICLIPCYHLAICWECYEDAQNRPQHCPDSRCGQKVANQVKIHL